MNKQNVVKYIICLNSADEKFDGSWPVNAVIKSTGTVEYTPPAMIKCM